MAYTVEIAPAAGRQIKKLPAPIQKRIIKRIEGLQSNARPPGVEKLEGKHVFYRVRVGDYRIIYEVQEQALVILIVKVGHRREVYRGV